MGLFILKIVVSNVHLDSYFQPKSRFLFQVFPVLTLDIYIVKVVMQGKLFQR